MLQQSHIQHFYDELFSHQISVKNRKFMCPWLEKGLNMDRHGRLTPCCTTKGERWSFGIIENLDRETVIQLRERLVSELSNDRIPAPCQGCEIAELITGK